MEIIKTDNLCYQYKKTGADGVEIVLRDALSNVDISIKKGEFVAVLGHNGSGKSTLAKHLNALLLPSGGKAFVLGMDTSKEENVWYIRQAAGMVFQNPDNQIIATIVEEDVAFGCENLGLESDEIRQRVNNALKAVHMEEFALEPPHFLSGGQKQRIAIAGILAMKPDCIILDEPTAMLDPLGRKEVIDTVLRLNKEENITVILITHFMDEAVLAKRVVVMEKGKIVMDGEPREVFKNVERLNELDLTVPHVTEIAYNLNRLGIPIDDGILTIDEMVGAICRITQK